MPPRERTGTRGTLNRYARFFDEDLIKKVPSGVTRTELYRKNHSLWDELRRRPSLKHQYGGTLLDDVLPKND